MAIIEARDAHGDSDIPQTRDAQGNLRPMTGAEQQRERNESWNASVDREERMKNRMFRHTAEQQIDEMLEPLWTANGTPETERIAARENVLRFQRRHSFRDQDLKRAIELSVLEESGQLKADSEELARVALMKTRGLTAVEAERTLSRVELWITEHPEAGWLGTNNLGGHSEMTQLIIRNVPGLLAS